MNHPQYPPPDTIGIRVFRDDDGRIESKAKCRQAFKVQLLADTFHSLRHVDGIYPWDVSLLATESIHTVSSGARQAILFVLSVWNPDTPEHFGQERFDIHHALKVWDPQNHQAFLDWARDPWWA